MSESFAVAPPPDAWLRIERQRRVDTRRRQARGVARQHIAAAWQKLFQHRGDAVELRRGEIERDRSTRLRRGDIDLAAGGERRAAEISDRQPFDAQPTGIEPQVGFGRGRGETGKGRAAEIDRQRNFARPFDLRSGQQRWLTNA